MKKISILFIVTSLNQSLKNMKLVIQIMVWGLHQLLIKIIFMEYNFILKKV